MALSPSLAERRIRQHEDRFGVAHVLLAAHAALPVVLDARLLHLLRINFFVDVLDPLPWTAETDLLFSPLCTDLGDGLYEIEPVTRSLLLERLASAEGTQRVREVASLLWQYARQRPAPWAQEPGLERAQELTALQFLAPEQCEMWLERAESAASGDARADRPWFIAMRRKLEPTRPVLNRWQQLDVLRGTLRELGASCPWLPRIDRVRRKVSRARAPSLRILDRLLAEVRGLLDADDDALIAARERVHELHEEVAEARFTVLYSALQKLGFGRQMAAAHDLGWTALPLVRPPNLQILGAPEHGHRWLAVRLLELILEPDLRSIVLLQSEGDARHVDAVALPTLRPFEVSDLEEWQRAVRPLLDLQQDAPALIEATSGVPEVVFASLCRMLQLDLQRLTRHFAQFDAHILDQRVPSEAQPMRPFNGRYVLVVGSMRRELTSAESLLSVALGRALATAGYGLVTGGCPGVDSTVEQSFALALPAGESWAKRLVNVLEPGRRGSPGWPEHGSRVLEKGEDWNEVAIGLADAVVLIGGEGWTVTAFDLAVRKRKAVFPIPGAGGAAESAFRVLLGQGRRELETLEVAVSSPSLADFVAANVVNLLPVASLADILETALTELERATGTGYNQIFLLSATESGPRLTAVADSIAPGKERYRVGSHEGLLGAALDGELVNEHQVEHARRYLRTVPETRSELVVPIRTPAGTVLGVINSESEREAGFDSEKEHAVTWLAAELGQQLSSLERWLAEQTPITLPWIQRMSSSRQADHILPQRQGAASSRAIKRYCSALHDDTEFLAQWPPARRVRVGDVGIFSGPGQVAWVTSLAGLGVELELDVAEGPATFEHSSGSRVATDPGRGGGPAHVTVSFQKAGAYLLHAKGCHTESVRSDADLATELLRLREQGVWNADWIVVTEVFVAEYATILLASASNSAVTLRLDSELGSENLAELGSAAQVTESRGSVDPLVAIRDSTPLFKALHVRTTLLGRSKVVTFTG
jgi:hypothetical protein